MDTDVVEEAIARLTPESALVRNLVISALVLAVLLGLRWIVVRFLHRQLDDPAQWYRARKLSTYVTAALVVLILGRLWIGGLDTIVTVLGVMAAGLAIALTDVVRNLAGGLYIALRHPLRIGDRVEIDGVAGDVVNVGTFGFNLLEIRNWVDADQSTGRILHVPNGLLFTTPMANFGAGFRWIWHEVTVPLTFASDWRRARDLLQAILEEHAPDVTESGVAEEVRRAARQFLITYTHLTPTVYVDADERGVRLQGRVLCDLRMRRDVNSRIWVDVLDAASREPAIELAYPPTRAYLRDDPPQGPSHG